MRHAPNTTDLQMRCAGGSNIWSAITSDGCCFIFNIQLAKTTFHFSTNIGGKVTIIEGLEMYDCRLHGHIVVQRMTSQAKVRSILSVRPEVGGQCHRPYIDQLLFQLWHVYTVKTLEFALDLISVRRTIALTENNTNTYRMQEQQILEAERTWRIGKLNLVLTLCLY